MRATFVRTAGQPDRVYVNRSDGSEVSWSFPTYGDGLPHDLVHLVVEAAFGLQAGFWGRVDEGADPRIINAEANRVGGARKYAAFGNDQRELCLAEALAGAPWWIVDESDEAVREAIRRNCARSGVSPPEDMTDERIQGVRAELARLAQRWRALVPKGALEIGFPESRGRR
jgi:hypothetical protein